MHKRDRYWLGIIAQIAIAGLLVASAAYAAGYLGASLPMAGFA